MSASSASSALSALSASSASSAATDAIAHGAPWLSVLIPVHNVKDYLRECLASVIAQAGAGVEVLMVDDCATDASDALVADMLRENITQLREAVKRNQG